MDKAIYLGKVLLLAEKFPEKKAVLNKKYEADYKRDVLSYSKMAYLWYKHENSKKQWMEETGSKEGFVNYLWMKEIFGSKQDFSGLLE